MNKKIFAIIIVIALILSSFTLAFANNNEENKDKKDNTSNKKIHVHLNSEKNDVKEVFVIFGDNDDERIQLKVNGNSGNYTVSKEGRDSVSDTLTKIIIVYSSDKEEIFSPAEDSQQGQEGQGSINYRLNVTESDDESIDYEASTGDNSTDDNGTGDNNDNGGGNNGTGGDDVIGEETVGDGTGDNSTGEVEEESEVEEVVDPSHNNSENNESFITIELTVDETPLGQPEPQEISTTEETPVETEIETKTLDLEDEETPLDIPSTGVTTPLFYGAGALISLVGLLKRR